MLSQSSYASDDTSALMGPCIAIMGLESSEPDVAKVDLLS